MASTNYSHKKHIHEICILSFFIFSLIIFNSAQVFSQQKLWEDSFYGGVTTGGYSPDYQSGGTGKFEVNIEKGSTIKKAYLLVGRFGLAQPITFTMNDKQYKLDKNNMGTTQFQSRSYGGASAVHVIDVTKDITAETTEYTIVVPTQTGPSNRFNDFYLFIAYENKDLKKINAAIFLRNTDIVTKDKFKIALTNATKKNVDFGISLFCGYVCHMNGDGENITLNGDKLGQLGGHDDNGGYCGGPIGSFYYKDNKLVALQDDNADKDVKGSDALINAKTLLKDKCKSFELGFEADNTVYGNHETNAVWGVIVAYGTEECSLENVTLTEDKELCKGSSVKLTASGGTEYKWSTGDVTASIEVKPEITTTYYVTVTGAGCSEKDSVSVKIFNSDIANAGNDTTVCAGGSVTLKANGGSTYKWSTGENTQSILVKPRSATTYTVTVSFGSCSATDNVTVNVFDATFANAGNDTTVCGGGSVTLKATGGSTYMWSTGEKTQSIEVKPVTATTYTVTVSSGACSAKDNVTVNIGNAIFANAGADTIVCSGTTVNLTAKGGNKYVWSNGEKTQTVKVKPKSTTTYIVTVSSGSCSTTDNVTVTVKPIPGIDAASDVWIKPDSSAVINLKGPDGKYKWWPSGGLSCTECKSPTVSPDSTTTYYVTYTTQNGCTASDSVVIHSRESQAYYVTNPFTPNGDGKNDVFMISLRRGKLLDFSISDKDSKIVFKSTGDTYEWNGKYSDGTLAPDGVYIYILDYTDENGKSVQKSGAFKLIR
jgi:gliding motility-associated-like protein